MVPKDFFEALWRDAEGVIELAKIGGEWEPKNPRDQKVFPEYFDYPGELPQFTARCEELNGKTNVYFGVTLKLFKIDPKIHRTSDGKAAYRASAIHTKVCTAVWIDVDKDFKETVAKLRKFPLKPSLGCLSGRPSGGIHAYWLLTEPAESDEELKAVYATNRALANYFGCDRQVVDMARILRVPGTDNIKYEKPYPCKNHVSRADLECNLDDFDFLPVEDVTASEPSGPQETPGQELPEGMRSRIAPLLSDLWLHGWRHRMALYVAGLMAHAGFTEANASELVRAASDSVGGDTKGRLKDVHDTYRNYVAGKPIAGAPSIKKMLDEFPSLLQPKVKKMFDIFSKTVKEEAKRGRPKKQANFRVSKLVKFDSRPARYRATVQTLDGAEFGVDIETTQLMNFKQFQIASAEQGNVVLVSSQTRWETMVGAAMADIVVQPAPLEATPTGEMTSALEGFLNQSMETMEGGMLRTRPIHDEEMLYFNLTTLQKHMKELGMKPTTRSICQLLRKQGWVNDTKRFGKGTSKVWFRKLKEVRQDGQLLFPEDGNGQS